jgi:hypothetical protein
MTRTITVDAKLWQQTQERIGELEQQNARMAATLRAIAMREHASPSEAARVALQGGVIATDWRPQVGEAARARRNKPTCPAGTVGIVSAIQECSDGPMFRLSYERDNRLDWYWFEADELEAT